MQCEVFISRPQIVPDVNDGDQGLKNRGYKVKLSRYRPGQALGVSGV
jgi:hypothetical protein